jgi:hypothetical protein
MKNITRKTFMKQAISLSSLLVSHPFQSKSNILCSLNTDALLFQETDIYIRVVAANTQEVDKLMAVASKEITELKRDLGFDFANLVSAYSEPTSKYYQQVDLIPLMEKIMRFLLKEQSADGTLNLGNFESAPDTAFILEPICAAISILEKNKAYLFDEVKNLSKKFILKAGDALTVGGIHTPNHRWVVSAALAQINDLYPNPKYVHRIDEWLSETIFIDTEGHYLERSMIYSQVIDRSLITMSRLLKRPKLLEPVRKNLSMVYYYIEPNGDVVTTDSRRQDQFMENKALKFYMDYRYMAIADNNGEYADVALMLENIKGFDDAVLRQAHFCFLEEPLFKKPLPPVRLLPTRFEKFFKETNLVRFRRDSQTATIFGGADLPLIIGSGRSTSPNLFAFRKGEAVLKYLRLSSDFFSTGYFRSKGIVKEGNAYVLQQTLKVPYYQPLPADKKRKDGNYKHSQSVDGRFWNKMDFENRPLSNVKTLTSKITIRENNGGFELTFDISGTDDVNVTIELCFKEGGSLSDMKTFDELPDNFFLDKGIGTYQFGKDTITFGNGAMTHHRLRAIDGEIYTSHFGSLRTPGIHVYLTGKTPFRHKLTVG